MASKIIKAEVTGFVGGALALGSGGAAHGAWGPDVTAAPTIVGTLKVGQTLTASGGRWTGPYGTTASYQWLRCPDAGSVYNSALLSGAVAETYRLVNDDQSKQMRVALIARTDSQYDHAISNAAGPVAAAAPAPAPAKTPTPTPAAICRGSGCPMRRMAKAAKVTRLSTFQRGYNAGARITIRISKPGYVSKVTVLEIRRGAAPLRIDGCLYPGHRTLQRCAS